jgi:hypothetical protein
VQEFCEPDLGGGSDNDLFLTKLVHIKEVHPAAGRHFMDVLHDSVSSFIGISVGTRGFILYFVGISVGSSGFIPHSILR